MTQSQLNKLIALSEKERLEQITKVANKISKLVGKSFKDVSALLQYARLINDRSLDPLTKKKVEKLADELFDRVRVEITGGISGALKQSEKLSNHIESQITGVKPKLDTSGSNAALQAYLNKKQSDGFRFSKRIWKHNNLYKKKMNDAITDALKTGKSAKQLSKDLAGFVSPKAKGKGIYTDPRKNAERLARSEINMAYRRADSERWAKQWFVVGIKVNLSPAHPIFDLCDALDNRYPKDFVFVGWHPQCLCYATPILCSEAEQDRMNEYRLGLRPNPPKLRTVNKMPKEALQWVEKNKERIAGWKSKPYWLIDNASLFKNKGTQILGDKDIKDLIKGEKTTLDIFRKDGVWDAKRVELHNKIIRDYFKQEKSSSNTVFMLGGAPANGKSTLTNSGSLPHPKKGLVIDADKIKSMIPEYDQMLKSNNKSLVKGAANFVHEESSYLSKRIREKALKEKWATVIDGVNDGNSEKIHSNAELLRKLSGNKKIRADYVTLDTDLSVKLAEQRFKSTGRGVPIDVVIKNNKEISRAFPEIIKNKTFDELYLWDTNQNNNPRLILEQKNGVLKIHNKELYERFLKKAN